MILPSHHSGSRRLDAPVSFCSPTLLGCHRSVHVSALTVHRCMISRERINPSWLAAHVVEAGRQLRLSTADLQRQLRRPGRRGDGHGENGGSRRTRRQPEPEHHGQLHRELECGDGCGYGHVPAGREGRQCLDRAAEFSRYVAADQRQAGGNLSIPRTGLPPCDRHQLLRRLQPGTRRTGVHATADDSRAADDLLRLTESEYGWRVHGDMERFQRRDQLPLEREVLLRRPRRPL